MSTLAEHPPEMTMAADDFQALEDKIYRTIEMYKAARQAQATAERDAQRLRQQMEDREEELVALRRETVRLKKEREDIRGRVEKMLYGYGDQGSDFEEPAELQRAGGDF